MQKHRVIPPSYHFRRSKDDGFIEVLNEGFYVMAEYSERTGVVKWQRVVLASQRERIEEWLGEHYPIQTRTQLEARRRPRNKAEALEQLSNDYIHKKNLHQ